MYPGKSDPIAKPPSGSVIQTQRVSPLEKAWQTLSQAPLLVGAMITLQIIWLVSIWLTGASTNYPKLLRLGLFTAVVGLGVLFWPRSVQRVVDSLRGRIEQNPMGILLVLSALTMAIGLIYGNYQRVWTWDEEQNFEASRIFATQGLHAFFEEYDTYPWLANQHPPLIPIINGLAMRVFGLDLLVIRSISLVFTVGVVLITFLLGRRLYNQRVAFLAASFVLTFPLVFRIGAAGLIDIQVTFFFALSIYLLLRLADRPTLWHALGLGLSLGAGVMSKYTMFLIGPVFLSYFLLERRIRKQWVMLVPAALIPLLMLGAWVAYTPRIGVTVPGFAGLKLFNNQTTLEQIEETQLNSGEDENPLVFIEPGWFLTDPYGIRWMLNSLLTRLPSAIGPYNIPLILLGAAVLLARRKKADLFLTLWVVTVFVSLLITIPDHRYFLLIFPALTITIANGLDRLPKSIDRAFLVSLIYCFGALYLFVDWYRVTELFIN